MSAAWEHGSDFHWVDAAGHSPSAAPWPGRGFGNGRQALVAALRHLGASRVWVPDYYCLDVSHAVLDDGFEVRSYEHCPGREPNPFATEAGDVIVAVDFFGWGVPQLEVPPGVTVLEDRTHRLRQDGQNWFASLRKTLPVPDGGWLMLAGQIDAAPRRLEHVEAANHRLTGMLLKREYLAGRMPDKAAFREDSLAGERAFSAQPSQPLALSVTVATGYDWTSWDERRRRNWDAFADNYAGAPTLCGDSNSTFVVLKCPDNSTREALRAHLVSERIYPAVLWSLQGSRLSVSAEARDFSETMLALHCDGRYAPAEMQTVASLCSALFSRGSAHSRWGALASAG